ncbi:URC4/urg3 family protein [Schlegelella sp. S2-27]|uniref:URC4/urg3 family protein n=1 Tax=Caldimonas mangrovi TaxID=2944811 RepID=A0ABT0YGR0_9BURK|nr:DUF1688 family protein [Caldimonas mangrovi]MCM5677917.1 URC4/urg3 family protein [Caldimonas mangrovi]
MSELPDSRAPGWHTPVPEDHPASALLTVEAVRQRCAEVMAHVEAGRSPHFTWHAGRLGAAADLVIDTLRARYPDLRVPYHSRWRHFEAGGVDRWGALSRGAGFDVLERARVRIDLVIPSVLLDAGAGPDWRFLDAAHGITLARSEGLGVASFAMFAAGAFSSHPGEHPLRSDAAALAHLRAPVLADAFQVHAGNPLVGLDGRLALLRRLGEVAHATPIVFGAPARLGHLLDYLLLHARDGRIGAGFVLATLLRALGPVWPGRVALQGVSLGDCWHHPAATDTRVPFHKLTQWLTYSLLEPLEDAGLTVTGLDALTGLPEYRNGGLLLDLGLLQPREPSFLVEPQTVDAEAVVEWRAVTVIALDRIAAAVRERLGLDEAAFPLARVLEGGTWSAGRRIAAERRPGGPPPVRIVSDGTVF